MTLNLCLYININDTQTAFILFWDFSLSPKKSFQAVLVALDHVRAIRTNCQNSHTERGGALSYTQQYIAQGCSSYWRSVQIQLCQALHECRALPWPLCSRCTAGQTYHTCTMKVVNLHSVCLNDGRIKQQPVTPGSRKSLWCWTIHPSVKYRTEQWQTVDVCVHPGQLRTSYLVSEFGCVAVRYHFYQRHQHTGITPCVR